MKGPTAERSAVLRARRVIIKVGSRTLAGDASVQQRLARAVRAAVDARRCVVIVSSGAVALGVRKLGWKTRPKVIDKLQAAAAAGQSLLMRAYEEAFAEVSLPVAQVLLTHADLAHRQRANNARDALQALLAAGAVPILNENDPVSFEEIKFGDNDQLAAMVTPLVEADLLLLLSDVEGVLDAHGKRIPLLRDASEGLPLVRASTSSVGTGGMASKLEAASRAARSGAHVVIADARQHDIVEQVLAGDDVGTLVPASPKKLSAKKAWIAYTLRPRGDLLLDAGAARAVVERQTSVLPIGVLGTRGDYVAGDCVRILDSSGAELGRGLVRLSLGEMSRVAGGGATPGARAAPQSVVVHRDEMVIW